MSSTTLTAASTTMTVSTSKNQTGGIGVAGSSGGTGGGTGGVVSWSSGGGTCTSGDALGGSSGGGSGSGGGGGSSCSSSCSSGGASGSGGGGGSSCSGSCSCSNSNSNSSSSSGGSIAGSSGCSGGGGSTASSSSTSGAGGSGAGSSSTSDGGSSIAVSSSTSGVSGSSAVSSSTSVGGSSIAVSSSTSGGGGSGTGSSAASGSGGSSAVSSRISGGGGSASGSGSSSASVSLTCMISQSEINWYRIGLLLYKGILPAMLSVLHNDNSDPYIGLPRDPTALYNELMKRKPVIDKLTGKPSGPKIINKDQLQVMYPRTKTTDSGEFDITLTVILIRNLLNLPKPQARWDKPIKSNDSTITANILRGQQIRNFVAHNQPDKIDTPTLDAQFAIGERILKDLKYTKCDTTALKTELLDQRTYSMLKSFMQREKDRLDDVESKVETLETRVDDIENRVDTTKQLIDSIKNEIATAMDAAKKTGRIDKIEDSLVEIKKMIKETGERKCMCHDEVVSEKEEIPSNVNIVNDGTSHFHFVKHRNLSLWVHHSKDSNPTEILSSFQRSAFIPDEIKCQLYECGYTRYYQEHEMDEHHLRKFRQLFSEDIKKQPWLLTNLYVDCVENLDFYEFLEKLQKWLAQKEYSFLLLNYSCEEHLRMLNVDVNYLKYALRNSQLEVANEHLLLYAAKDDILMNIRFVTLSDSETETKTVIDEAVSEGQSDLKLFACLHMGILDDSNITLVSVTVLNNIKRKDVPESVCAICSETLLITRDEWLEEEVLQRKLDTIIAQKQKISMESKTSSSSCIATHFEKLSSRLWGWLCTRDVYLPNLSIHGPSCLARIYLNAEQLRFMHLKQRHLMLKGPYGSGKSIMGMTKFRQLAVKATSSTRLYFICCSSNTMYTALMKSRLREMLEQYIHQEQLIVMNLDEYAEQYDKLKPVMLSNVLQDLAERHNGHVCDLGVIFDEYDASNLTEQEACSIDTALLGLKDSHVIITCQSMEITRKKVTKSFGIMRNKTLYDAFMFGSTNMHIETFHLTMRNCTRVNELSRSATQIIESVTNEFFERTDARNKEVVDIPTKATNKEINNENLRPVKVGTKNDEPKVKKTSVTHNEDSLSEGRTRTLSQSIIENETLIFSGLFDHIIKNVGNTSQTYTGACIKSTFKFPGNWINGHSVEGDIPQIIYPFGNDDISYDNVNSFDIKVRMQFALKYVIHIMTRLGNIGVICFDPIDAQLFHNVLLAMGLPVKFYAPVLFPTQAVEVVPDLKECAQTHIVITDHIGAQGLELNQLIVSIDPNEKYVHQYLVEAMTRCINTLFVMLISKQTTDVKEHGGVCKRIVDNWINNALVEVSEVTFCKEHQKDDTESLVCENENAQGKKNYHIHHWHEEFESCTAISDCEEVPIDMQRVAQISRTIMNAHHVKEMIERKNCKNFAHVASVMMDIDLDAFRNEYKTSQLIQIRGSSGETLLDVAAMKFLVDYVVWLKSIGVPGSPVRLQHHRGSHDKVIIHEDNGVEFNTKDVATIAAPGGAVTFGAKVMFEVTLYGEGNSTWCSIGWAKPGFLPQDKGGGKGVVGRCAESYAFEPYDGWRQHRDMERQWGITVRKNTTRVLGVAANLQSGTLEYSWDGNWDQKEMGVAFNVSRSITLFPAISFRLNGKIKVNFGEHGFKFKPPDSSFRGINDTL